MSHGAPVDVSRIQIYASLFYRPPATILQHPISTTNCLYSTAERNCAIADLNFSTSHRRIQYDSAALFMVAYCIVLWSTLVWVHTRGVEKCIMRQHTKTKQPYTGQRVGKARPTLSCRVLQPTQPTSPRCFPRLWSPVRRHRGSRATGTPVYTRTDARDTTNTAITPPVRMLRADGFLRMISKGRETSQKAVGGRVNNTCELVDLYARRDRALFDISSTTNMG